MTNKIIKLVLLLITSLFMVFYCLGCTRKTNVQNIIENNTEEITESDNDGTVVPIISADTQNSRLTINEILNMNIPEIGDNIAVNLYKFKDFHLDMPHSFGYEEIEERLKNSYLLFQPTTLLKDYEEALIFDADGIIQIIPQFGEGGQGNGKHFVVLGRFNMNYDDAYNRSKSNSIPPSNESIVTFHCRANASASDNGKPYDYEFLVYYTKMEF